MKRVNRDFNGMRSKAACELTKSIQRDWKGEIMWTHIIVCVETQNEIAAGRKR
jgi:hypothetical protein